MKQNLNIFFYKLLLRVKKKFYFNSIKIWSHKNLNSSKFIISFDFETQRDIEIIEKLTNKLKKINILPYYAIPGELIEKNSEILKSLGPKITYINHGYKVHTKFCRKKKKNFSSFSYLKKSTKIINEDIKKGDLVIKKVLKQQSRIFRTPHFGEFCEKEKMNLIYKILSNLNYKYSLSTTPIFSLINKPIYVVNKITEIPCNAYIDNPKQVIDSWSLHIKAITTKNLIDELNRYYNIMLKNNMLLNIYFDPSDIIHIEDFFFIVSKFSKYQIKHLGS
tara:strand:- start:1196 stop:2026 length:831 start_codon:yes stop_codon:yes gene_type:complete